MRQEQERGMISIINLSCMREEILCAIVGRLVLSRRSIEAMHAVYRHWRYSVSPTRGP